MQVEITRRLEFDAGHRLLKHEGKCANLHGHRYVAEVTVSSAALDCVGRVVDFSEIKTRVGGWIDRHWDHGVLLQHEDPIFRAAGALGYSATELLGKWSSYGEPPTVENMVRWLGEQCSHLLPGHLRLVRLRLYETPNCWADWRPSGRDDGPQERGVAGPDSFGAESE